MILKIFDFFWKMSLFNLQICVGNSDETGTRNPVSEVPIGNYLERNGFKASKLNKDFLQFFGQIVAKGLPNLAKYLFNLT